MNPTAEQTSFRAIAVVALLFSVGMIATAPAASAQAGNNSTIALDNQTSNGTTVTIESVTLPEGGFISVHNESLTPPQNETIGSIIGVTDYLDAGTHRDLEVVLDRPISHNQTVIAKAARDTNGNQTFDVRRSQGFQDTAYSSNGSAVTDRATIQIQNATSFANNSTVTLRNQSTAGTNVTVRSVTVPEGGFVVIHGSALLPPKNQTIDSIRGISGYLDPGVHQNITVELNETIDENTTLIAAPYRDTNNNQTFEYAASEGANDTPYRPNGSSALISQANVSINESARESLQSDTESSGGNANASASSGPQMLELLVLAAVLVGVYLYLKVT
ncbi:DUF7282 domain-containing protein [Halococcus saccharolyticus]|nr:hypothetical protein [Halococcus saccharolyticus]